MASYLLKLFIKGFSLLWLLPYTSNAQEWAPTGAKWYYETGGFGGLTEIESVLDTTIKSLECKKFEFSDISLQTTGPNTYYWNTITTYEYFYSTGDSIFHYDKENDYFYKLYDFSLNEGDTNVVRDESFPGIIPYVEFEFVVDSIDTIEVEGFILRAFYTHFTERSDWTYSPYESIDPIIEFIGSSVSFLGLSINDYLIDLGSRPTLRCYQDDNIIYRNIYLEDTLPCDYLPPLSVESWKNTLTQVYPNPVTDYLTIDTENSIKQLITIRDSQGKLIYAQDVTGYTLINMSNWDSGVYFLQVNVNYGHVLNKIILKL